MAHFSEIAGASVNVLLSHLIIACYCRRANTLTTSMSESPTPTLRGERGRSENAIGLGRPGGEVSVDRSTLKRVKRIDVRVKIPFNHHRCLEKRHRK